MPWNIRRGKYDSTKSWHYMLMRVMLTSLWNAALVSGAWCSGSLYGTLARAIVVQASSQAQSTDNAAAAAIELCLELGHSLALGVGGRS